jgi:hypothetical protein
LAITFTESVPVGYGKRNAGLAMVMVLMIIVVMVVVE